MIGRLLCLRVRCRAVRWWFLLFRSYCDVKGWVRRCSWPSLLDYFTVIFVGNGWRVVWYYWLFMDQVHNFFIGNTATNYVEAGFSDREAEAMAWIADQKPLGKFVGVLSGSFVAFGWGHFHHRIFGSIGLKCNKLWTQLAIVSVTQYQCSPSSLSETIWPADRDTEPMSTSPITCTSTTTSSPKISPLSSTSVPTQRKFRSAQSQIHRLGSQNFRTKSHSLKISSPSGQQKVDFQP